MDPASRALALQWRDRLRADLWGSVMPFWAAHSEDRAHGGFFNNLDHDGACFDTTKHVWLQGRQVWMFAKLATTFSESEFAAFVAAHPSTIAPGATGSSDQATSWSLRRSITLATPSSPSVWRSAGVAPSNALDR